MTFDKSIRFGYELETLRSTTPIRIRQQLAKLNSNFYQREQYEQNPIYQLSTELQSGFENDE